MKRIITLKMLEYQIKIKELLIIIKTYIITIIKKNKNKPTLKL